MVRNFAAKAVHKYMYPATYNFRDDADGAVPSGWTDGSSGDCSVSIIAELGGHKKVLKLYDNDGATTAIIYQTYTAELNPTVELWIAKSTLAVGFDLNLRLQENGTTIVWLYFSDDNLDYYDSATAYRVVDGDFFTGTDTFVHLKLVLDDTANTFACYRNGVLLDGALEYNNNSTTGITKTIANTIGAHSGYSYYIDAIGYSWDTDYAIGDNCFWRHYGESAADTFEEDDVGSQGTSITWVDLVDTEASFEIVAEFNEHKKVLRGYYSSAAGGYDYLRAAFADRSKDGWVAFFYKTSDVTVDNYVQINDAASIIINFGVGNSVFEYRANGGAWTTIPNSPTPVNDTWYFFYIQWYDAANDNFDLWIDNIQYLDGVQTIMNQPDGVNLMQLMCYSPTEYLYIDAPISSLDGDERADNRIFDYNDPYTREDITTTTQNVIYTNILHLWRTATLISNQDYEQTILFFQIYDINSKLAMEAEIANRIQNGQTRVYTLLDKNQDDLLNLSSNTFSADDIHDPTDSTCMLKTVLPNVSEADGDLILVNADTKTDTYSTVTKNYPDGAFLRDISDLSDACIIIEANGKSHLDDDLASGDSLDFDNAADHSKMLADPQVNDILDTINYFEVFGAINPDTGERFYKITDNSGTDRKRKWRITNNSFRNQTDLDAYAAKLVAKLVSVKEITISVQGLGAHNMGTLFTYKYDNAVYTIPSAAYYIIEETMDFDTGAATIVLSEGLIEGSKYSSEFEKPQNYSDTDMAQIYETDLSTINLNIFAPSTTQTIYGYLIANNELWYSWFYVSDRVDDSRDIILTFNWFSHATTAANHDGRLNLTRYPSNGVTAGTPIEINLDHDVTFTLAAKFNETTYTITATDVVNDNLIRVFWQNIEGAAKDIYITNVQAEFYIKRSL